jgi:hypothetical protein
MSFQEEDFLHLQTELLKLRDENYELKNRCQQKETQAGDLSRQLQATSKRLSKAESAYRTHISPTSAPHQPHIHLPTYTHLRTHPH